jgi:hypothetical protein
MSNPSVCCHTRALNRLIHAQLYIVSMFWLIFYKLKKILNTYKVTFNSGSEISLKNFFTIVVPSAGLTPSLWQTCYSYCSLIEVSLGHARSLKLTFWTSLHMNVDK